MSEKIIKAVLLAAGLGTRLRPVTFETPKPLLKLNRELLIDHQLKYLARAGIIEVVINLHHLGEKIRLHVGDGSKHHLHVVYSEESKILGTGGGIKKASTLLGRGAFVALNADALTNVDIKGLISRHEQKGTSATMAVKKITTKDDFTPVNVDDNGLITKFGRGEYFYIGVQVLTENMLDALPPIGTPACLIKDGYMKLLKKGRKVAAFIHEGYSNDLGTMERYERAKEDVRTGKLCLP